METSVLHHVEICVKDETSILKYFQNSLGFRLCYFRSSPSAFQWVLKSDRSVFIVTRSQNEFDRKTGKSDFLNEFDEVRKSSQNHISLEPQRYNSSSCNNYIATEYAYPILFCHSRAESHLIDTVFNVALEVRNVDAITQKIATTGGSVIHKPFSINDTHGTLRISVVESKCENVIHTLLDKSEYKGSFLPGFQSINDCNKSDLPDSFYLNDIDYETNLTVTDGEGRKNFTNYIDHVTYVCRAGESEKIINWYENCFHMKRFLTNSQESIEEGFVLGDTIGLRIKALQFWRCAETGVASKTNLSHWKVLRLVIAEPLPDSEASHVSAFLRANQGPGVQHIGLHCHDILTTVTAMRKRGVRFRMPPPTYYEEIPRMEEVVEVKLQKPFGQFRESGILLDVEQDEQSERYLMQIFTQPVFEEDTFFLEVIQRCGATGFGAGNISALARSIIRYQETRERQENNRISE